MVVLETQAELRSAAHVPGLKFRCYVCGEAKDVQTSGGTGYGYDESNQPVCYACCANQDRERMIREGRITLYLTIIGDVISSNRSSRHAKVSNWPGTLSFPTLAHQGRHNIAGKRYDVWFTGPDGKRWHGVTYGDNTQICHCKRTKGL